MPIIRHAKRSDAQELAVLAEETFRDTFGSANTVENMAAHCQANYSEAKQATEISDAGIVTLVCEESGNLVAFAQLRWTHQLEGIPAQSPGEIQRLYVAGSWHGKGVAQALMAACIKEMQTRNSDAVWLGVWEHNPRAVAFYKKFGFVEIGAHVFWLGVDQQRDLIMLLRLGSASPPSA